MSPVQFNVRQSGEWVPQITGGGGETYPSAANLICFLDAEWEGLDDLADGDQVFCLPDLSGANNHAQIGAWKPSNTGTQIYGFPQLQTAERNDSGRSIWADHATGVGHLILPNDMWSGKTQGHLFIYVKSAAASGESAGPWAIGAGDNTYFPFSNGLCYDGALTNTRYSWTPTMTIREVWRIYEVKHDGTTWKARIDGVDQSTQTVGFTAPDGNNPAYAAIRVLGYRDAVSALNMHMAGFMAYDAALDDTAAGAVRTFLTDRYGSTG